MAAKKRKRTKHKGNRRVKRKKYFHLASRIPGGIQVTPLKLVKERNTTDHNGKPATFYKLEE